MPSLAHAVAFQTAGAPATAFSFERRDPLPDDVVLDILYCGICHTDVHHARGDWGRTQYPCVPGHEIVGRVTTVGSHVTRFKAGDTVAVGCLVGSCRHCPSCDEDQEQFCENGFVTTYNGRDPHDGSLTKGGYSDHMVVDQHFVLRIDHDEKDLPAVAPLLCAGVTTWSPLKHWGAGPGKRVGIVGLGGLGHMGVKLAAALGAEVWVFTTSPAKRDDAIRLGAKGVIVSTDADDMKAHAGKLDLIVNTVAVAHDPNPYLATLKRDGTMVLVGVPAAPHGSADVGALVFHRRAIAGSFIGGIAETQEMLDFCHANGIVSDIEMVDAKDIDAAFDRVEASDVRYRFVIDMATLPRA